MTLSVRTRLDLRVSAKDRELWESEAKKAGLSLSAWIKTICNRECEQVDWLESDSVKVEPTPRARIAKCSRAHLHRPGQFCKFCPS